MQLIVILVGIMLFTSCRISDSDQMTRSVQVGEVAQVEDVPEMTKLEGDVTTPRTNSPIVSDSNFSVITVGTGTPKFSESQSSSSTMIQYKGGYYLVDCGDGCNANLPR